MQDQEVEVANPMCYECRHEITDNFQVMAGKRVIFYFHEKCFLEYLDKFRKEYTDIQKDI